MKIGQYLDNAVGELDLEREDMITEVAVVIKVVDGDGEVGLVLGSTCEKDWIQQRALHAAAVVAIDVAAARGLP